MKLPMIFCLLTVKGSFFKKSYHNFLSSGSCFFSIAVSGGRVFCYNCISMFQSFVLSKSSLLIHRKRPAIKDGSSPLGKAHDDAIRWCDSGKFG